MNTWTAHHPCPFTGCAGELVIEYEAGKRAEEFFAVLDEVTCEYGHFTRTLGYWDQDAKAYNDAMHARYEEAREAYWQGKGDRY